jgi:ABC-2 type transport system ATP-binding protein
MTLATPGTRIGAERQAAFAGGGHAVAARGLIREFGGRRAVDELSLAVSEGEIYGFLGPNGAGKTTTVRMLTTLLRPTGGRAQVAGIDVVDDPAGVRLRIGVALQEASLDLGQTGRELLTLQARLFRLPAATARRRIDELIELVDLGTAIDRRVATYSGGMRRRLDLALALVHQPRVLFLDEPTSGLDPVSRRQVWSEVRRLNREQGLTVFLTTQYLEEADELAERIGIIVDGRLAAEGAPAELKRRIGRDVVVVRFDGEPDAARSTVADLEGVEHVEAADHELRLMVGDGPASIPIIAARLAENNQLAVREMTLRRPSLDDVFLEVTGRRLAANNDHGDD